MYMFRENLNYVTDKILINILIYILSITIQLKNIDIWLLLYSLLPSPNVSVFVQSTVRVLLLCSITLSSRVINSSAFLKGPSHRHQVCVCARR